MMIMIFTIDNYVLYKQIKRGGGVRITETHDKKYHWVLENRQIRPSNSQWFLTTDSQEIWQKLSPWMCLLFLHNSPPFPFTEWVFILCHCYCVACTTRVMHVNFFVIKWCHSILFCDQFFSEYNLSNSISLNILYFYDFKIF